MLYSFSNGLSIFKSTIVPFSRILLIGLESAYEFSFGEKSNESLSQLSHFLYNNYNQNPLYLDTLPNFEWKCQKLSNSFQNHQILIRHRLSYFEKKTVFSLKYVFHGTQFILSHLNVIAYKLKFLLFVVFLM